MKATTLEHEADRRRPPVAIDADDRLVERRAEQEHEEEAERAAAAAISVATWAISALHLGHVVDGGGRACAERPRPRCRARR